MDEEHVQAWQKIKKHLAEHQLQLGKGFTLDDEHNEQLELLIEDIDEDINKVEQLFMSC
jgi:hypothetical protein